MLTEAEALGVIIVLNIGNESQKAQRASAVAPEMRPQKLGTSPFAGINWANERERLQK